MIRRMQKEEIDQVAEIWLDVNRKAHDFIPASYWEGNFAAVRNLLLQAELYIWEEKMEIAGFVGLDGEYIAGIFVKEGRQSEGIGKQLLDFVKDKKEHLWLHVYEKNGAAVRFYRREKFRITCEGTDQNTGEKESIMVWDRTKEAEG